MLFESLSIIHGGRKLHHTRNVFRPGRAWLDTEGRPIQAHGGGILHDRGTYYWYGEHKGGVTGRSARGMARMDVIGISCYSSKDLYNWKYEGLALPAEPDNEAHDLHPSRVVERPKVIHNDRTGLYVMWMHIDTEDYRLRSAGVAVSDAPTGPFRYVGSWHPNGLNSADQTLFKDDDGTAYHVHSSNWNSCTVVSRLSDDYLLPTGDFVRILDSRQANRGKEAPALCKRDGLYYLVGSECTSWFPNAASYAVAERLLGEWRLEGNPCVGEDAEKTFHAQGTFILPVVGLDDAHIFMADRWNPVDLGDSRYVWLPVQWDGPAMRLEWMDEWDLDCFGHGPSPLAGAETGAGSPQGDPA